MPAVEAKLRAPRGVAVAPDGSVYVADSGNDRVFRIDRDGVVRAVAGGGAGDDGEPAVDAFVLQPSGVAIAPDGSVYISEPQMCRVRRVDRDGVISTVAGHGRGCQAASSADGVPATEADLDMPTSVAIGVDGSLYIAEWQSNKVRRVGADGRLTTVAGAGGFGDSGDGGRARDAQLASPLSIATDSTGNVYIADTLNARVRVVGPDGVIRPFAGTGALGDDGDGGPALAARLTAPSHIAAAPDGSVYITDDGTQRVRRVGPDGRISLVAGRGVTGFAGDGGLATEAELDTPSGVAAGPDGAIYVADRENHRVRRVGQALPGFGDGQIALSSVEDVAVFVFDGRGRHLETLDMYTGGQIHAFDYDASGRLVTVTDASSGVTTIERDAGGEPTAVVGPYGHRTALATDAEGNLAQMTDALDHTYAFEYAGGGLLTALTDARRGRHTFSYDAEGRLRTDVDPTGATTALTRIDEGVGYRVTRRSPLGLERTYGVELEPSGVRRRIVEEPGGARSTFELGFDGRRRATANDGTVLEVDYRPDPRFGEAMGHPASVRISTPGGRTAELLLSRDVELGEPSDPFDLITMTESIAFNGRTHTRIYDGPARREVAVSPEGRELVTELDARGRERRITLDGLAPVSFEYDANGRLARLEHGARDLRFGYDDDGNMASFTDALGRVATLEYDLMERIVAHVAVDGRRLDLEYDAHGNLVAIVQPGRSSHRFEYDVLDQMILYQMPAVDGVASTTRFHYDLDRRLERVDRHDGSSVAFAYDDAGRIQSLTLPGGQIGYAYDGNGRPATIESPSGVALDYTHDGFLLTSTTWRGPVVGSLTRTYDDDLRVAADRVDGTATIEYARDGDDLLITAGDLHLTRDSATGQVVGTTLGQTTETRTYDVFGDPESYRAMFRDRELFSVTYERDMLGRVTARHETVVGEASTWTYAYDTGDRLSEVRANGALVASYTYDESGNRASVTRPGEVGGEPVPTTLDARDRLVSSGEVAYQYNGAGERVSMADGATGETWAYDYDALSNAVGASGPDGLHLGFLLDGQDRRVARVREGAIVQGFLYDGRVVVAELDTDGSVVSRFIRSEKIGAPDYMVRDGRRFRIISDHVGSPRLVVDTATGEIAQHLEYDSFGRVMLDTRPGFQPFGFAGGLLDPDTALVRFGSRDYDPQTGHFLTPDPRLFDGGDANLYRYAFADPINAVDATGELAFVPIAVGALVGGGSDILWQFFLEGRSFGCIDWGQATVAAVIGGAGGQFARWFRYGRELKIGRNFRLAPFGNRNPNISGFVPHKYGRWPHYHRRGRLRPNGHPRAGQGIRRHRPFEPSPHDRSFWDRF